MNQRAHGRGLLALVVALLAGPGAVDLGAQLVPVGGTDQVWYLSRQLRDPVVVELPGTDAESCVRQKVRFDAGGDGAVSPPVAQPRWVDGRCRAEGWWRLGETVGVQHMRASVEGIPFEVTVQAIARQGARIFFGAAWTPSEDRWTELVASGEGAPYLKTHSGESVFRPVIGIDFPLWPSWRLVRAAVGAGGREIDRTFYYGLSLLQSVIFGPAQEASAVDVHMGIQLSRRDVGYLGAECAPAPYCTRRQMRFSGVTFMVTIDGASAFRGLAGSVLR